MKMPNNIKLLELSLKNPESVIDPFYLKSGSLVISPNLKNPTKLMRLNRDLLEGISAYKFAQSTKKNGKIARQVVERITDILQAEKSINYSEFVSFWPVLDISYSLFQDLPRDIQLEVVQKIIEKYIEKRHALYSLYGYTPVTLQVSKDAKAHKESGSPGLAKVGKILDSYGFRSADNETFEEFLDSPDKKYIETDKKGKKLFKEFIQRKRLKFAWSKEKDGKMPDFLIKHRDHIYILEHKHKKEGGGGQSGAINEVISLISFAEKDRKIHYVSFLDGIYFNLFARRCSKKSKIPTQLRNIKQNLQKNRQNYFVNTAGFKKLLSCLG